MFLNVAGLKHVSLAQIGHLSKPNNIPVIAVLLAFQKFVRGARMFFVVQLHLNMLLFVETHFVEQGDQGIFLCCSLILYDTYFTYC